MELKELIQGPAAIAEIALYLDGLSADQRLAQSRALDRKAQRALYAKAGAGPAEVLADLVPPGTAPRAPVVHHGRNTLPLPGRHKLFEKRFCRPEDGSARLFGFNEAPSRSLIGPGFFVARHTAGTPAWESRGGVVIDYFQVPDGAVAAGWPEVVPNSKGLQRFVYHRTRDFLRHVSQHVSVGAAYKEEKALDHYFVLCRSP